MDVMPALRMFRGVPRADVEALVGVGSVLSLETGALLQQEGKPVVGAWVLLSGRLVARLEQEGVPMGDLWPGAVVGEEALFGRGRPAETTVTAATPVEVLHLAPESLDTLPGNRAVAALQRHLIEITARRLKTVDLDRQNLWRAEDRAAASTLASTPASTPASAPAPAAAADGLLARLRRLLGGE